MNFPKAGTSIEVHSFKHNGKIHRIWEETIVLKGTSNVVIGGNDRILVKEADGRHWRTREPAICYFNSEKWVNTIGMIRSDGIYYYCNLGSPFTWDSEALKYIDYDLDIKVFPDMTYTLLDEDEYKHHREIMGYPEQVDRIIQASVNELISWVASRKGPFDPNFVEMWYERFLQYRD